MARWLWIVFGSVGMVLLMVLMVPSSNAVLTMVGTFPVTFPMVLTVVLCLIGSRVK